MKWPGVAAVDVALVSITKQKWSRKFILGGKEVKNITPYLDDSESIGNPFILKQNANISFQGSIVLGKGFVLEPDEAKVLIAKNSRNKDVLFPYLNGDDLNNSPDQSPSRWVINFFDWEINKARYYSDCYEIIEKKVKPERQRWAIDRDGNEIVGEYTLRKPLPEKWWIYGEKRPALYRTIDSLDKVIAICRVTKYVTFSFADSRCIFSDATNIITKNSFIDFALLNNSFHDIWSWKTCSTMGGTTLRYSPSDCLETYPVPHAIENVIAVALEEVAEKYYTHRKKLMLRLNYGLTKTYNIFHSKYLTSTLMINENINAFDNKSIEKTYGREVLNFRNNLQIKGNTCSFKEAIVGIIKLRELHVEMDKAVLEAYGWQDINLRHDFYELEYLPENDRIRFTIHPDARKEILKRLLELNHKIHEEEVKAGLWDKKSGKNRTTKSKTKTNQVNEGEAGYGGLFG